MGLLTVLIIGGLVGWLASAIGGREEGILGSIAIGVVGSFIGSFVSKLIVGQDRAYLDFSWSGMLWSLGGALILVFILNAVRRSRHA